MLPPATSQHQPVLLDGKESVLSLLTPSQGESILDVTVGLGGHAEAFLRAVGSQGSLVAFDADTENLHAAATRLREYEKQCTFIHANFRACGEYQLPKFHVIFADLGVSSPHFDDPSRGFTFRHDATLDLRYDQSKGETAAEFLSHCSERDLTQVFRSYGELSNAKSLAHALYSSVRKQPITTTGTLRKVVESICGYKAPSILPQVFQALRIHVNDELGALETFLRWAPTHVAPGGRLGIISYHSLEDRLVKTMFRILATPEVDEMTGQITVQAPFRILTKKPVVPSPEEISRNPRARSAKFRALQRI